MITCQTPKFSNACAGKDLHSATTCETRCTLLGSTKKHCASQQKTCQSYATHHCLLKRTRCTALHLAQSYPRTETTRNQTKLPWSLTRARQPVQPNYGIKERKCWTLPDLLRTPTRASIHICKLKYNSCISTTTHSSTVA